jgi:hypothetical protein
MSFNLESFKSKLKDKGIEVNASATEVVAFSWSVEGIEKVPKLGEVLFYKVNGVEYGVKPKRGSKHDIHWYYDQLKTGMKGAKGYAAGLVQFLNVWVKKTKELVIVYKDDKIVESEFEGEVCTASPQLVGETGIDNLLLSEMNINANKWNHGATGICWDVILKGDKVLVIEYLEDEGVANITYRKGSVKKDIKSIKTVDDLRSKIHKCLSEINSKVTSELKESNNPEESIATSIDDTTPLDKVSLTAIRNYLEQNNIEFDVKQKGRIYTFTFDCGKIVLDDNNQKAKLFFEGKIKEVETMSELNNFFSKCKVTASPRKYRPSIRERMDNSSYLDPMEFDVRERKDIEKFNKFRKELVEIEFLGKKPFNAFVSLTDKAEDLKSAKTGSHEVIEDINVEFRNGCIKIKCDEIEMDRLEDNLTVLNEKYKFQILDYVGEGKFTFGDSFGGNDILYVVQPNDLDWFLKQVRTELKILSATLKPFSGVKVTAELKEGEEVDTFINDVNKLTIGGKKVFNAEKKGKDIVINLILEKFETPDMDRLNELVEDKLEIIFPITQKWMDADKGHTFGNSAKVGDIVLYTDEWSSQEFSDSLIIEPSSKINYDDLCNELATLYNILAKDCSTLNTNLFKVTADVNEQNFKGIGTEHDRLMYVKVSPQEFITLWKSSTKFNPTQLNKIVLGFKLASRMLSSKYENSGINIGYFYKKQDGKGYMRVEYKDNLYIIYVSLSDENGDIKVVTRKMKKMIPVKNFNLLSTSVSSLSYENATLPPNFKKVWEEVTKD